MLTTENDLLPTYLPLKYQMDEAMEVGFFGMILYPGGHDCCLVNLASQ